MSMHDPCQKCTHRQSFHYYHLERGRSNVDHEHSIVLMCTQCDTENTLLTEEAYVIESTIGFCERVVLKSGDTYAVGVRDDKLTIGVESWFR